MAKKIKLNDIVEKYNNWEAAATIFLDRENGRTWLETRVYLKECTRPRKASVVPLVKKEFYPDRNISFTVTPEYVRDMVARSMNEYKMKGKKFKNQ